MVFIKMGAILWTPPMPAGTGRLQPYSAKLQTARRAMANREVSRLSKTSFQDQQLIAAVEAVELLTER